MERYLSLVIMTRLPATTSTKETLVAVLQVNGHSDTKTKKKNLFPGCHKVSCYRRMMDSESFYQAFINEIEEEFGRKFTEVNQRNTLLHEIMRQEGMKVNIITFAIIIPSNFFNSVCLKSDVERLDFVSADDLDKFQPIRGVIEVNGPPPGVKAMNENQLIAVRKTFELFQ